MYMIMKLLWFKQKLENIDISSYKYIQECFAVNSYLSTADAQLLNSVEFTAAYNNPVSSRVYYIEILHGVDAEVTYGTTTKSLNSPVPYGVFKITCRDAVYQSGGSGQIISYPGISISKLIGNGDWTEELAYAEYNTKNLKLTVKSSGGSIKYKTTPSSTITY